MSAIPDEICGTCYHPKEDAHKCSHPKCDICKLCKGTGKLYGAQNWSESFIKKHGSPYYTADCDCQQQESE